MKKQKDKADTKIDLFLKTLSQGFGSIDPKNFWPLNAGQIDAYFSDTQAAEIYDKIHLLKEEGVIKQADQQAFSPTRDPALLPISPRNHWP